MSNRPPTRSRSRNYDRDHSPEWQAHLARIKTEKLQGMKQDIKVLEAEIAEARRKANVPRAAVKAPKTLARSGPGAKRTSAMPFPGRPGRPGNGMTHAKQRPVEAANRFMKGARKKSQGRKKALAR